MYTYTPRPKALERPKETRVDEVRHGEKFVQVILHRSSRLQWHADSWNRGAHESTRVIDGGGVGNGIIVSACESQAVAS